MTLKRSLQRIEREQERTAVARRAFTARTEHLTRLSREVHPLLLIGSAFLVGLLGGHFIGRARLPDQRIPAFLLSPPMRKALGGLVEKLFAALAPAPPTAAGSDCP